MVLLAEMSPAAAAAAAPAAGHSFWTFLLHMCWPLKHWSCQLLLLQYIWTKYY